MELGGLTVAAPDRLVVWLDLDRLAGTVVLESSDLAKHGVERID